ncbi:hypothetical protein JTB14_018737 [Gonioctena quinquepunctata]|nr:hypothetical protein JTB14_018737 [Gonioctena quinquepunctata]
MSRNYIKKKTAERYSQDDLLRAVSDVKNKNSTYHQASQEYNIPVAVIGMPEHLQKARKDQRKPEVIYSFYKKLKEVVIKEKIDDAMFVFNADESGFGNDPSRIKAIGEREKTLSGISGGSGRESTSVLACVAADGSFLPPFIIFKGGAVQARWTSPKAYPGTVYSVSTNGWMEEAQFFNWFESVFVKWVKDLRVTKNLPDQNALLLYEGHKSHISLRIIECALGNKIVLVMFPSHLTDRLQPLDKCVFGPVKTCWEKKLIAHGKKHMGHGAGRLKNNDSLNFWRKSGRKLLLKEILFVDLLLQEYFQSTLRNIVAVFSSAIVKTLNVDSNRYSAEPKKVTPRLKQARYGEVLTTAEVVERLKEAERQKDEKTTRKNRPRLKNNSNEKQKRKRKKDSESEEEKEVVPYDENSDGEFNQDEWAEKVVAETYPEVEYTLPEWHLILPGIYLLVKFRGGSRNSITYKYVCRVRDVDEETGDIEVVGFRRNDRLGAEYVEKETDISSIEFGMIEALLPNPKTSIRERKIIHIFPGSVNVFEI